jgi:hypothetical protein
MAQICALCPLAPWAAPPVRNTCHSFVHSTCANSTSLPDSIPLSSSSPHQIDAPNNRLNTVTHHALLLPQMIECATAHEERFCSGELHAVTTVPCKARGCCQRWLPQCPPPPLPPALWFTGATITTLPSRAASESPKNHPENHPARNKMTCHTAGTTVRLAQCLALPNTM